jgi:hypothetical protein
MTTTPKPTAAAKAPSKPALKTLITWAEVMGHARQARISEHTARKILCRQGSPAKIHLPTMQQFRYDEAVVLREFGLL